MAIRSAVLYVQEDHDHISVLDWCSAGGGAFGAAERGLPPPCPSPPTPPPPLPRPHALGGCTSLVSASRGGLGDGTEEHQGRRGPLVRNRLCHDDGSRRLLDDDGLCLGVR